MPTMTFSHFLNKCLLSKPFNILVPVCIDHYLVAFKEDNIKAIVSHGEIRNFNEISKGASCHLVHAGAGRTLNDT